MARYKVSVWYGGLSLLVLMLLGAWGAVTPGWGGEQITLNVATAGDTNMVEYVKNKIGPLFQEKYPQVTVRAIGTGPGNTGSRKIYEKLKAEADAGSEEWDIDVAVVHQIGAIWLIGDDLLMPYTDKAETAKLVSAKDAEYALGASVKGYVLPMFHSQTAIAYNPEKVPTPPKSFSELVEWVKQHPGKFGYNGIKHGMSGVSFTTGWLYWKTGKYDIYALKGPYDKKYQEEWPEVFKALQEFNKYVTITSGNAGTLDALNRGEIWMGPVWVDMFYTWMAEGKMSPKIRLTLLDPGLAGQPMYYVIPKKAKNQEMAIKFIELATSPEVQAKYIVKDFNWYPGIDAEYVKPHLTDEEWNKLFIDITPEDLKKYGRNFPMKEYFDDMLEAYEKYGG